MPRQSERSRVNLRTSTGLRPECAGLPGCRSEATRDGHTNTQQRSGFDQRYCSKSIFSGEMMFRSKSRIDSGGVQ